jgi:hypothetical protein
LEHIFICDKKCLRIQYFNSVNSSYQLTIGREIISKDVVNTVYRILPTEIFSYLVFNRSIKINYFIFAYFFLEPPLKNNFPLNTFFNLLWPLKSKGCVPYHSDFRNVNLYVVIGLRKMYTCFKTFFSKCKIITLLPLCATHLTLWNIFATGVQIFRMWTVHIPANWMKYIYMPTITNVEAAWIFDVIWISFKNTMILLVGTTGFVVS